jgi:ketosteroid isomerase-like protein
MSEGIGSIQEVLENYRQAVNKRDSDAFLSAYSTDVHIYDAGEVGSAKGKMHGEKTF